MTSPRSDAFLILILRLSAGLCLLGWAWVHLYWEGPYGILLWNENTYALAESWGIGWEEFVGSGANDGLVQTGLKWIGWLYVVCAAVTISVRSGAKIQMTVLALGTGFLTVLSYAKFLSAQLQFPMFLEHGGQMLSPALLGLALTWGARHRATVAVAIIAFIATFAGHGCYAIGWLPTPGNFHAMTSLVLGVEFETANLILRIAGVLDFIVCIGILIPATRQVSAIYATAWGLMTAIARPVAGMSLSLNYWGADQYLHEAVLRAPHFLLPLFLFLLWRYSDEISPSKKASSNVSEESRTDESS
ncbi:MAG: hypothetical protein QNL51_04545 [Opitutaceae bacterium]